MDKRITRDNYIVVQGWQVADLGLKGNELLIYACIYGFSQGGQSFTGSLQYLADWTNTTKRSVMNVLKSLLDKGLLEKKEKIINNIKFCEYRAKTSLPVKKVHGGDENFSPGVVKNFQGGSEKFSTNNIDNNILDNLEDKRKAQSANYSAVIQSFNDLCPSLPSVRALSESRKQKIRTRLRTYSLEQLEEVFRKAEASRFLTGNNDRNWTATFDWLMNPNNIAKVLDGNFDNRQSTGRMAESKNDPHELDGIF